MPLLAIVGAVAEENVVQSLRPRIWRIDGSFNPFAFREPFLHLLTPAPSIERTITRSPVFLEVEPRARDRPLPRLLRWMIRRSQRRVRMQHPPNIPHRRMCLNQLMCQAQGHHIEIPQPNSQMPPFSSPTHQFRYLPCLRRPMTKIAIIRLTFIRCMEMRSKHLDNLPLPLPSARSSRKANRSARNAFTYIPITAKEGRWAAVEGVAHHGAFHDGIRGEDGETAAEDAGVVKFGVGEDAFG